MDWCAGNMDMTKGHALVFTQDLVMIARHQYHAHTVVCALEQLLQHGVLR